MCRSLFSWCDKFILFYNHNQNQSELLLRAADTLPIVVLEALKFNYEAEVFSFTESWNKNTWAVYTDIGYVNENRLVHDPAWQDLGSLSV